MHFDATNIGTPSNCIWTLIVGLYLTFDIFFQVWKFSYCWSGLQFATSQKGKIFSSIITKEGSPPVLEEVEKPYVSQISTQAKVQHSLPILVLESIFFNPNLHIIMELPTTKANNSTTKSFDNDNRLTLESFRKDSKDIMPLEFGVEEEKNFLSLKAIETMQMWMKICKEGVYQLRNQL